MKVVFHFGPPKSGTSAIQKWMSSNRQWLIEQGIYYPAHVLDVNGVSSGNLRKVFVESEKGLEFSDKLMASEIAAANSAQCHTIVFSSEFFFKKLEALAGKVAEAQFIGYVRFGLEMMQSSYNQAVKRHGRTETFRQKGPLQPTLRALSESVSKIGEERFILRPYSKKLFVAESIVADFLGALGINSSGVDTSVGRINPSYSIESIEIKRWFNQLQSESFQTQLDLALQSYGNSEAFSLFTDDNFEKNKTAYLEQLRRFLTNHNVANSDAFYEQCAAQGNRPYHKQELSLADFKRVLTELLKQRKLSRTALYLAYNEAVLRMDELSHPERVAVLKQLTPRWLRLMRKLRESLRA